MGAVINREQFQWAGATGLPGFSTFYCGGSVTIATFDTALKAFMLAIRGLVPSSVTLSTSGVVDQIDSADGSLVGSSSVAPYSVTGTDGSAYAAGTGAWVNWTTATYIGGRRLRGRTFLCPLGVDNYATDGTLATLAVTTLSAAAAAFVTAASPGLEVWHRPVAGAGGNVGQITGSNVPDRVTSLRSRRH